MLPFIYRCISVLSCCVIFNIYTHLRAVVEIIPAFTEVASTSSPSQVLFLFLKKNIIQRIFILRPTGVVRPVLAITGKIIVAEIERCSLL